MFFSHSFVISKFDRVYMKKFISLIKLLKDEKAAAAVEYALIVALVSGVCITSLANLGQQINITFLKVASVLEDANIKAE